MWLNRGREDEGCSLEGIEMLNGEPDWGNIYIYILNNIYILNLYFDTIK